MYITIKSVYCLKRVCLYDHNSVKGRRILCGLERKTWTQSINQSSSQCPVFRQLLLSPDACLIYKAFHSDTQTKTAQHTTTTIQQTTTQGHRDTWSSSPRLSLLASFKFNFHISSCSASPIDASQRVGYGTINRTDYWLIGGTIVDRGDCSTGHRNHDSIIDGREYTVQPVAAIAIVTATDSRNIYRMTQKYRINGRCKLQSYKIFHKVVAY